MKRFFKWTAFVVGSLFLLLVLIAGGFLGWLRWSGERDWKRAEAELRAKGEKLTFAELVPPMPPDSENFFADPIWAEFADLIPSKNDRVIDEWNPRVPSNQRQLNRWESVPLTPEEKERLSKLMPTEKEIKTRKEAFFLLKTKVSEEKYPQKQKEIAALSLEILSPAEPVLSRIAKLSERPQAQFPIRYDLVQSTPLPQLSAIHTLAQIIHRLALSELILGKNPEAASDTMMLVRLSSVLKKEPLLISYLVRISSAAMALNSIHKGILDHAWTEADLQRFQGLLQNQDLQQNCLLGLNGERCFFNQIDPSVLDLLVFFEIDPTSLSDGSNVFDKLRKKLLQFCLRSIFIKDKAYQNLWLQRNIESLNAQIGQGWNAASAPSPNKEAYDLRNHPINRWIYMLNWLCLPAISGCYQKAAEAQTQVDQTLIACALERYRIAHGSYPTSLDQVVPDFLAKLPHSPITGKPMNYSLKPDGTFLLWSPGWNLTSLGGKPGEYRGDGDIVWGQPLSTKTRPPKVGK